MARPYGRGERDDDDDECEQPVPPLNVRRTVRHEDPARAATRAAVSAPGDRPTADAAWVLEERCERHARGYAGVGAVSVDDHPRVISRRGGPNIMSKSFRARGSK